VEAYTDCSGAHTDSYVEPVTLVHVIPISAKRQTARSAALSLYQSPTLKRRKRLAILVDLVLPHSAHCRAIGPSKTANLLAVVEEMAV
jgi:hypothetical protein